MMIENHIQASAEIEFSDCCSFGPIEWLVIAIGAQACSKPLSSTRFGTMVLELLNDKGARRLETLRRTAELAKRCGWAMPCAEIGAFLRAGWSEDQLEVLIESILADEQLEIRAGRLSAQVGLLVEPDWCSRTLR
ncbi:hypothetical protein QUC32_29060 (plasmid) [Novosphingobium resinovorum]|uniref:hypothetical protein n=2 Tax=Novosphingobium TaxID=165696 RepID=UPI0025A08A15|nr:hypothetical protein [Novosphingobium resinovorum]MBF7015031.1 hypothetical protein [Novosphingobium sp. HR1a]WJM29715.1 hypothetical protein QUC32_29060 [Novosphingobium resinovorum]